MVNVRLKLIVGILIGVCFTANASAQTAQWVFFNATPNAIPGTGTGPGPAAVYPSLIDVAGVTGVIYHMTVSFRINHTFPGDIDILLRSPGGRAVVVMSDIGSAEDWVQRVVTFDDCAPRFVDALGTSTSGVPSGRYRPSNSGSGDPFTASVPTPPYGNGLSEFNRTNANGQWQLFVMDDAGADVGSLEAWSLTFHTQPSVDVPVPTGFGFNPVSCMAPDYDGDGRTDVAVYRPATGDWFVSRSGFGGDLLTRSWGAPASSGLGDLAVPADYDGDGLMEIAVYRAATGDWFISNSFDGTTTHVSFGAPASANLGDTPVPGDYDGDGRADLAIYRSTTGEWFLLHSSTNTVRTVNWGYPPQGDYPARR